MHRQIRFNPSRLEFGRKKKKKKKGLNRYVYDFSVDYDMFMLIVDCN